MIRTQMKLLGAAGLIAGVMLLGFAASNRADASPVVLEATATDTPAATATLDACQQNSIAQHADIHFVSLSTGNACTATATSTKSATQGPSKTHTPTPSGTAAPSSTAAPTTPTAAAPATQAPAPSAARPGGGNEGVQVRPPNTGSGDGAAAGGSGLWVIVLGATLVALGGGSLLFGVRKRG